MKESFRQTRHTGHRCSDNGSNLTSDPVKVKRHSTQRQTRQRHYNQNTPSEGMDDSPTQEAHGTAHQDPRPRGRSNHEELTQPSATQHRDKPDSATTTKHTTRRNERHPNPERFMVRRTKGPTTVSLIGSWCTMPLAVGLHNRY